MKFGKLFLFLVVGMFLVSNVFAAGMSIQLKRTNPGVAGKKSAELIFDVVNTDMTHKIEGFIWCRSPDDAVVSSSMGVGSGSGAQYVSPIFTMDSGPYQKSMSLTIEADTPGDKRAGCIIKYIPYKEKLDGGEKTTTDIDFDDTITSEITDVSGFQVSMTNFVAATEATEDEEAKPAVATIKIDDKEKEIEVGTTDLIGILEVTVKSADETKAEVVIKGQKTTVTGGTSTKKYLKMNGVYVDEPQDMDYRELRLDKTIPFVSDMSNPECPEGKTSCKASEVVDVGGVGIPKWAIVVGIVVIVLLVFYLWGKSSRS